MGEFCWERLHRMYTCIETIVHNTEMGRLEIVSINDQLGMYCQIAQDLNWVVTNNICKIKYMPGAWDAQNTI